MQEGHGENHGGRAGMGKVVDRNILALLEHQRREETNRKAPDRLADIVTRFTGSMHFVCIHLVVFALWIVINLGWIPPIPRFDPTFVILAMAASVEAIFLSTFVLITQNRMAALAEKRAELDLQISLLAEHEITRLLHLVIGIGEKLGIDVSDDPEMAELKKDVRPEKVLARIEVAKKQARGAQM